MVIDSLLDPWSVIQVHQPSISDHDAKTLEQLLPTTASKVLSSFHALGALMAEEDVTMWTIPKCS